MNLNIKWALAIIENYKTRAQKNSFCWDVYGKSYEDIKKEFEDLLEKWITSIPVDIVS